MTDFGQVDTREDYGYGKHQDTQDGIRHHHIATFLGIIEEKLTDAERGEDAAQSIKRLGQIEATCRRLLAAQLGDIRIGSRLQEHQSATDDEQACQEGIKATYRSSGDKQQGTDAEKHQSEDHTTTIAIAIDKDARRYRHQEIAQIGGYLNQGGVSDTDMQSILEVLVEHIQNGTSEAPQKEERRYQHKRNEIISVFCFLLFY